MESTKLKICLQFFLGWPQSSFIFSNEQNIQFDACLHRGLNPGPLQGAASLTEMAKLSWHRHFFSMTSGVIVIVI